MKLSVVIMNYNYGLFVGQAIESALAIDWHDKEIIVVDDGSTDDSRRVIESFGERVTAIFKANGGQPSAANAGFERSTGDVVIFLDADDVLLPSVAQQVASVWRHRVANVQYGLIYVDKALKPLGECFPVYTEKNTPEWAVRSLRETGTYQSSMCSGNAWSRDFLKEVFPVPTRSDSLGGIDVYLPRLAPFFGDVISLTTPQCLYRRHNSNDTRSESLTKFIDRLSLEDNVHRLANKLLQKKNMVHTLSYNNEYYTKLLLLTKRFFPSRYPASMASLLLRYWREVWRGEFSAKKKFFLLLWSLVVVASPRSLASWVALNREQQHTIDAGRPIVITFRRVLHGVFQ
jgi:glycosyltransferase involved in cell wall biosynthesis